MKLLITSLLLVLVFCVCVLHVIRVAHVVQRLGSGLESLECDLHCKLKAILFLY